MYVDEIFKQSKKGRRFQGGYKFSGSMIETSREHFV